jgi:RNA polymerase sigma-70 factor (ECF subfamily)
MVVMAKSFEKSSARPADNGKIADDELLVEQFNKGNASAFDKIAEKYSADVATLANRLLGWGGDVEDVVQDVFLAAFVGIKKFRHKSSLKTWLFTITINKCRTYRYRRMLRLGLFSKGGRKTPGSSAPAGDRAIMEAEKFSCVRRAVMALPTKYREAVVLRYLQELETDEICQVLGISKGNLHTRLSRAREKLKQSLVELTE